MMPLKDWSTLDKVIDIDQMPIGRTPRPIPQTYTTLFTVKASFFAQVRSPAAGLPTGPVLL